MQLKLSRNVLKEATSKNDLIKKTAAQIIKDFAEFSLNISFSGHLESFYEELYNQMHPAIGKLMDEQYSLFLHFLYRIDVSEKEVRQYQIEMGDAPYLDALTELIIHREMKKVMIREYFKAHSSPNNENNNELSH